MKGSSPGGCFETPRAVGIMTLVGEFFFIAYDEYGAM
jgi:hypothetical protein